MRILPHSLMPSRANDGFALVVVLAALAVLIPLGSRFMTDVTIESRLVANLSQRAVLEAAAEAGVSLAILELDLSARALKPLSAGYQSSQGHFCALDKDITVTTWIEDEAGKLDLNLASPDLIGKLLLGSGYDQRAADALTQAILERRSNQSGGYPGFLSVDELANLPIPRERVKEIRKFFTVHSSLPGIKPAVASKALLERLSVIAKDGAQMPFLISSPGRTFTVRALARRGENARFSAAAVVQLDPGQVPSYRILQWSETRSDPEVSASRSAESC